MKTKLITGAIIGATLFGGALSVSATGGDNNARTDIGVDIVEPAEGSEILTLKAVPSNYKFESLVTADNDYSLTAKEIGNAPEGDGPNINNQITVHKNYSSLGKWEVRAKVSALTLARAGVDPETVGVDSFTINGIGVVGTGSAEVLYTDSDFAGEAQTTGNYAKIVESATIGFKKADLKPSDKLTGKITYTVGAFTPATPTH